jgi:hypothetical protein
MCWRRQHVDGDGRGLYALADVAACPSYVLASFDELAERGIVGVADALPVPVGPEPQAPSGGYPLALPWAALMDDEDLQEFLGDLLDSLNGDASSTRAVLDEVEKTCGTWRLVAEAQHGHNTAPGPDAVTRVFSPVASLREPEGEHYEHVHHTYRVGHDLPETGGPR